MQDDAKEFERRMLQLPTLKHVGMGLLHFTFVLQSSNYVKMEGDGMFRLHFIDFAFPKEKEAVRLRLPIEVINDATKRDLRFLPIVNGFCDVERPIQLAAAIRYIEAAHGRHLTKRLTVSPTRN